LQNGHRCQFIRAQDLFDEMYASLGGRSTRQLLNRLARLDILLIDESMVDALLSRVRHYCHTVTIDGPSLRELQG
jgi:DNA replication protein DnaC